MFRSGVFLSLAVVLASSTMAADKDADGWHSMFDGKTFSGWKKTEHLDSWKIVDGNLQCTGERSHLFYVGEDRPFKNFEFECEVMTTPGSNAGIYFHTKLQEEGWPRYGYECQVNITHKDPKKTGSLYAVANIYVAMKPEPEFTVRVDKSGAQIWQDQAPSTDGEWFDYHIIVVDDTVTLKINGETMVQWTQPEGWEGPKNMPGRVLGSGTIALQAHDPDSEVHYRNIKLKILD